MKRHTSEQHRVSKSQPHITDAFTDYCHQHLGILVSASVSNGTLKVKASDYADWLLARQAAREQFGFDSSNVEREII